MASLQKFKLLATRCSTVAESPTRSPVIHLRRRKTLRMLLTRSTDFPEIDVTAKSRDKKIRSRRKLRELFVTSPPPVEEREHCGGAREETVDNGVSDVERLTVRRRNGFNGLMRPVSATFRCRLIQRVWRPVLVTIPEQ
ncbi:unnamed protein product [Microthlaspi erraticum]|uniref:Uncharacterized protein n=1 Tax=Microthlaspi erraticum TaxID=1685480 RepID=A0A6D2KQM8_9BRAS|nr:unnamed protein product [Microthlaspi erraticum]CAA7055622.1 unnamed protein product [Microthlaspi erraticum]